MSVGKNLPSGEDPNWWPQICPADFGQGKKKSLGCLHFCAAAACCALTEEVSSRLPQKEVVKCQRRQSSEDDKESTRTQKNQLLFLQAILATQIWVYRLKSLLFMEIKVLSY